MTEIESNGTKARMDKRLEMMHIGRTNADRIRAMTDEELERWITAIVIQSVGTETGMRRLIKQGRLLDWLKEEVEDEKL